MKSFINDENMVKTLTKMIKHLELCDANGGLHNWGDEQQLLELIKQYKQLIETNSKGGAQ